ncbi:MAG: hypothetical protein Q9160_004492 [Pyrenula sp. 1 TL-2023]
MRNKLLTFTPLALSFSATIFSGLIQHNIATAVTGIRAGVDNYTDARPFRTEINDFAKSGAAFDLYIQALMTFQNQSGDTGYFEIAGIHGYPLDTWQGVKPLPGASNEQILWDLVGSIAMQYPYDQLSTYLDAVDTWRIPYWDWADSTNSPIPPVVATPEISINTFSGWQTVKNPLYTYRFPDYPRNIPNMTVEGYNYEYMEDRLFTIRQPTTGTDVGVNGTQNNTRAYETVAAGTASLHQMTYQLLSSTSVPFNNFATDANHALSIEQIHDQIHDWVGGLGGHMYYITWSAFDPIFWLHHANIDRLFAIWQALNPDTYITPQMNPATFASPVAEGNVDTPLYPFRKASLFGSGNDNSTAPSAFHTPSTVRSTKTFGYTYPEVVDWKNVSASDLRAAVIAKVNKLYNTPTSVNSSGSDPHPTTLSNSTTLFNKRFTSPVKTQNLHSKPKRTTLTPSITTTYQLNNLPTQYILNLSLPLQSSSLTLNFYLGAPPPALAPSPSDASNLLAAHSIFSSTTQSPPFSPPPIPPASPSGTGPFRNLTDPVPAPAGSGLGLGLGLNLTLHAQVPLTASLLSLVLSSDLLEDLSLPAVEALLQSECVTWRVRGGKDANGEEGMSLEGLMVQVLQRDVVPTTEVGEFPGYGEWREVGACVRAG